MDKRTFQKKTKDLGLHTIRMIEMMPRTTSAKILGGQILRCSTSVGANYRAACRSKSRKDFINKLKIVEEEADETLFWLEMIEESGIFRSDLLKSLKIETNEILSMIVSSLKTLRANQS